MSFITPKSDWLTKLSSSSLRGNRWRSRYFVLLDSELRYYKDEHNVSASSTLSLRDVSRVVPCSFTNRPYCFRLEPNFNAPAQDKDRSLPPWTIECNSEHEQGSWIDVIQYRLHRLSTIRVQASPVQSKPKRNHFYSFMRILKSTNPQPAHIPSDIQPSNVQPSNIQPRPRPQPEYPPSLSRRRGVVLSPLATKALPYLDTPSDSVVSSASSGLESPMLPVQYTIQFDSNGIKSLEEAGSLSPTFLMYKDRFL
ncbi:hypothetical protein CLU79DRAFT_769784 [Phycomyces nitens]|nr:hypothetical protein CLU79DRAFT_769784 [Phycomyces nitens]